MAHHGGDPEGNFVSEWFGHRIFPRVVSSKQSTADQKAQTCPFLSRVKRAQQSCVKPAASRGVCTINSSSNGPRQDWVVCPYRAFDPVLFTNIASRLYGLSEDRLAVIPAPNLENPEIRRDIEHRVAHGGPVLVYFDAKIGGEISLSATTKSPEMAFDVTFVALESSADGLRMGRFAILEIQTMDFHGSYRKAVENLDHGLRLHRNEFPDALRENLRWAGEGIEGPNIANVFKRTFYQMMFKFSFGSGSACAGTALALPVAVWDSWRRFLGSPELVHLRDGTYRLKGPKESAPTQKVPAWIYLFDLVSDSRKTPSPLEIVQIIGTTSDALSHYALKIAPEAAAMHLISESGIYQTLRRRLLDYWPQLELAADR